MRQKKAELLYNQMSFIDDKYLDEALNYKPKKKNSFRLFSLIVAIVSVFSVFIVLGIGTMLLKSQNEPENNNGILQSTTTTDNNTSDTPEPPTDSTAGTSADRIFDLAKNNSASYSSIEALKKNVLDAEASSIIWFDTETGIYYSKNLSALELRRLETTKKFNREALENEQISKHKVWLMSPNGIVTSPELKESSGNTSVRMLFDYEAELVMSETFTNVLSSILY